MTDLLTPLLDVTNVVHNKRFILDLHAKVDKYCVDKYKDDPRDHLGASIIGSDCKAHSWGVFRWLKQEEFDGRMHRLFQRGHREEEQFIDILRGAGFTVWDHDPNIPPDPITGKLTQFRITGVNGHFGGSLDAILWRADIGGGLGEFKTHNTKSFAEVKKKGVVRSKPKHWRQQCSYGRAYGYTWSLYCAVNKDTDELYFEWVSLDYREADDLFRKAEEIINSQVQPMRIAQSPEYADCKYCTFSGICFKNEIPSKNCRSCKHAVPVDNGEWLCSIVNQVIPDDFIPKGCDSWDRII